MAKKIIKNPNRIIETVSVKDGHIEKTDEFWSAESLRKRPIDEQYPKLENETDDQYNERLQEIQDFTELAQAELQEEDKREIENGAYTERSGRAAAPNYEKFGVSALRTFDMAEKNPDLLHSDDGKYGLERQQAMESKANYYVELCQKHQPELSEFSGLVPDDQIARDQSNLRKKENEIRKKNFLKNPEVRDNEEKIEAWDRAAEAILYPLVLNFGLFDNILVDSVNNSSAYHRARAIYPSKYDDQFHGVDAAFMIPIGTNEQGEIQYIPTTFDCTTSMTPTGVDNKFGKVSANGRTKIDYAKTEEGDLVTGVSALNFIIGIDHSSLFDEKKGLTRGDTIAHASKAFLHDIYVQIHDQASLRESYYEMLRCKRGESKDANLVDVLSEDEYADACQASAIREFFGRKCEETVDSTDRRPYDLKRNYGSHNPVLLVWQKTERLLRNQQKNIEIIKKQKGWE